MLLNIEFLDDATRPPVPKLEGLTDEQRAPGACAQQRHRLHEYGRVRFASAQRAAADTEER